MIQEIKAVTSSASAQISRIETLTSQGCMQLAMAEALLSKKMNALDAVHLYLDASGAIESTKEACDL